MAAPVAAPSAALIQPFRRAVASGSEIATERPGAGGRHEVCGGAPMTSVDPGIAVLRMSASSARVLERRAVEAAIWGMPIVACDAMRQAFFRDAGGSYNDILYLSRPADWRFQITTPNASCWYVYIPINTSAGPIVLDVPPAGAAGLFGNLNDAWQAPIVDIGPVGEDRGRGGKYVVLPPGYDEPVPDGCIPVRLRTYNGYAVLRAIPPSASAADVAAGLDLVQQTRIYTLAQAAQPPRQRFIDMAGKLFDGIPRFDDSFFDSLARIISEEPVQERDLIMMAYLRSLGIEKGRRFKPDPGTREILRNAAGEARAGFIRTMLALPPFVPGTQWAIPASHIGGETGHTFATANYLDVDARGQQCFFGRAAKRFGIAAFYLATLKDGTGAPLDGSRRYRLRVPPHVPARQFWAATVYDCDTAAFVRQSAHVEINSYDDRLRIAADGSVDVTFGPSRPGDAANWIATPPGRSWVALFRFYGPDKTVFEKKWTLPDITVET